MPKPHKFEVNPTTSGSLTHFEFFLDRKKSNSKNKIFFNPVPSKGGSKMTLYLLNTKVESFLTPMYFYINVYKNRLCIGVIFDSTLVRLIILQTLDGVGLNVFFSEDCKKNLNIEFSDRFRSREL
jgi:hypothetical protein